MKITGSDFINLTDPPVTVTIPRVVVHDFLRAADRLASGQGMRPRHMDAIAALFGPLRDAVGVVPEAPQLVAKVGDEVTEDNVSDLPIGTVVEWVYGGREFAAVKIAMNRWAGMRSLDEYFDFEMAGGAPTYIQSLPGANHAP